jgi:hypothetical protein
MMVIENNFNIGDIVFLKTDKDQSPRIVTAIILYEGSRVNYRINSGTTETWHTECEITLEKDVLITTTN